MRKIRPFTLFLCVALIALAIVFPSVLKEGLYKNIYSIQENRTEATYRGILNLWHVVSWHTGQSSGISYLKQCIQKFEQRHAYLYIELEGLTKEEAVKRLNNGETPDIISFPTGFFRDAERLMPATVPGTVLSAYAKSAAYAETTYGCPYMAGGYLLIINEDLMMEAADYYPAAEGMAPDALLSAARSAVAADIKDPVFGAGFEANGTSQPMVAAAYHVYPSGEDTESPNLALNLANRITIIYDQAFAAFTDDRCALLIGTQRELSDLAALDMQGKSPVYTACAFSRYTDMVQYVGIMQTDDPKKADIIQEFIRLLVSDGCQRRLEALNVFPVIVTEDMYPDTPVLKAAYKRLIADPAVPNTFTFAADYYDNDRLIKRVFDGDTDALHELFFRIGR